MDLGEALYTISIYNNIRDSAMELSPQGEMIMEENNKELVSFLRDAEVKVVWREEDKTKVGRGMITNDDENFVYLSGSKGTVIVNKKDIIAIKQ
jgi:hypothetical protein